MRPQVYEAVEIEDIGQRDFMRHRVDVEHLATRLKDDSRIGDIGDAA